MKIECFDINNQQIELSEKEKQAYIDYVQKKNPNTEIEWINIIVDDEYVNLKYKVNPVPFDRIRRITGYLTGNTNTWNDAKKDELKDRVLHK